MEFIDIGGPTMIRAAAKNYQDVIVLTDPADYEIVIEGLKTGDVPIEVKRFLAGKVFNLTSAYDAAVSRFMLGAENPEEKSRFTACTPRNLSKPKQETEYRYLSSAHLFRADGPLWQTEYALMPYRSPFKLRSGLEYRSRPGCT